MTEQMNDAADQVKVLNALLNDFSRFQKSMSQLTEFETIDKCYDHLSMALSTVLNFEYVEVLTGLDASLLERQSLQIRENFKEPQSCRDEEMVEWCLENENAIFVGVEDAVLKDLGYKLAIYIPLVGQARSHGIVHCLVSFEEKDASKFLLDLLNTAAREFTRTVENMNLIKDVSGLRDLMNSIIESVPQGIMAIDKDDSIVVCNNDIEFLLGVSRLEILDEPYNQVFSDEVNNILQELVFSTLAGQECIDLEHTLRRGQPDEITVGISTSLLYSREGQPEGVVIIIRDLALSREVQKLRELDTMKSEFLHTVSHELKTPLTAILGGTEILVSEADDMDEDMKEIIGVVDQGGKRLNALITDLLSISRIESGKVSLEKTMTALVPLVLETVEMVSVKYSNCHFETKLDDDVDAVVDPLKIKQVFENLIGNAAKYSPEGGTIAVVLSVKDQQLMFSVSDQGIGIPEDQLELVFDKFYRVDSSTTASIEGTGLGLPIVKHIVESHGGSIQVRSELGQGSTFEVILPH